MSLIDPSESWRDWPESRSVNFFQTFAWAELLSSHFPGFSPAPIVGSSFVIPMVRRKRLSNITSSLYGMPFLTTGGILQTAGANETPWGEINSALARLQTGTMTLVFPPGETDPRLDGFNASTRSTHLLDLSKGWDKVWSGSTHRSRKAVRKGEKSGVEVRRDHTDSGLNALWAIAQENSEAWGANPLLSRAFLANAAARPESRIFLAELNQRILCACLAFTYGREIFFWMGGRTRNDPLPGAYNQMICVALQEACEEQVERANLGSSMGVESIEWFKDSLGGIRTPYVVLSRVHPLVRVSRRLLGR